MSEAEEKYIVCGYKTYVSEHAEKHHFAGYVESVVVENNDNFDRNGRGIEHRRAVNLVHNKKDAARLPRLFADEMAEELTRSGYAQKVGYFFRSEPANK